MKKVLAVLLSVIMIFSFSANSFAMESSTDNEYKTDALAPIWKDISHFSYTFYVMGDKAYFSFTLSSNTAGINATCQLYKDGFIDTKVDSEQKFSTDKKFLSGEFSIPVESDGEYYMRVRIVSGNDTVKKDIYRSFNAPYGDVNGDGKITALDARLALRASAKLQILSEIHRAFCDINLDGKITAKDARIILRIAAKLQ